MVVSIVDGVLMSRETAGWRTSRYSTSTGGTACVQAGLSMEWPDGMVTLGNGPRRAPGTLGGSVVLRPATGPESWTRAVTDQSVSGSARARGAADERLWRGDVGASARGRTVMPVGRPLAPKPLHHVPEAASHRVFAGERLQKRLRKLRERLPSFSRSDCMERLLIFHETFYGSPVVRDESALGTGRGQDALAAAGA